jgi:hypothetical protein
VSGDGITTVHYYATAAAAAAGTATDGSTTPQTNVGTYYARAFFVSDGQIHGGKVYTSASSSVVSFSITAASLTPVVTVNDKVYDTTTAATIATRSLSGTVYGSDMVQLTGGTAAFADPNVGTGKLVTVTGLSLTGAAAGNYLLTSTTATTTASITPAPVDHLAFTVPSSVTAGTPFQITVTAQDAYNNTVTGFTDTVHFAASNGAMANYTFQPADMGSRTFTLTLTRAATLTVTGTDTTAPTVTGNTTFTITPAAPDHIFLNIPSTLSAGVPFSLTITVQDAYGNTVTGYTGTINVQLTGPVMAMANVTFTAADMGSRTFNNLVLNQTGMYTLTATDVAMTTLTGTAMFTVM